MSDHINRAAEVMLDGDPGLSLVERLRAAKALDAAGRLATYPRLDVEGDWLIEVVNEHTCGAGPGSGVGCEPGCGAIPVGRLVTPEHDRAVAAKALRDAADALPAFTEGEGREGIRTWKQPAQDAYSLAVEESQAALRVRADRIEAGGDDA